MTDTPPTNITYADLAQRVPALLIDFCLLFVVGKALQLLNSENGTLSDGIFIVFGCACISYFWALPKYRKATLGQFILGFRILPEDDLKAQYGLRLLFGSIALLTWYITILLDVFWSKKLENIY